MRIAVIGSGIAGMSAAWALSQKHEVVLFEKAERLGMDAEGVDVDLGSKSVRVDVPLRVFYPKYYPTLSALYERLGIKTEPVNYETAFFNVVDRTNYFRYHNVLVKGKAIPYVMPGDLFHASSREIVLNLARFYTFEPGALIRGRMKGRTLGEYMTDSNYSTMFLEKFLYPAFAGICTCSLETVRNYPAEVVIEYLTCGILTTSVRRVKDGTAHVCNSLTGSVKLQLGSKIAQVFESDQGVTIADADEGSFHFDHAIFATQANQALRLLGKPSEEERAILTAFPYEKSVVVMHSDEMLMPADRYDWTSVNYAMAEGAEMPVATIWMNAVQPELKGKRDIFQTWNPLVEPREGTFISKAQFQRPYMTLESYKAMERLEGLHNQPGRRIFFCGSYASFGIPLLESAVRSALRLSGRFGCQPFELDLGIVINR